MSTAQKAREQSDKKMDTLKNADASQLLGAALHEIDRMTWMPDVQREIAREYLHLGFLLARPGGWERIAPQSLYEFELSKPLAVRKAEREFRERRTSAEVK